MSQQKDDAEHMADEHETDDIEGYMDADFPVYNEISSSDSEDTDKRDLGDNDADTSAAQARKGRDIQGIPWDRIQITRERYRQTRMEQYRNYEDIPHSGENSEKECKITKKEGRYYDFRHNFRSVKSTILHFQLRNLVWASSKHDVYLLSHFSIIHWSSLTSEKTEVLNVAGHVAPSENHPGSLSEGFTRTQISTLAVKDNLLVAGGFQGELICKNLNRPGVTFCTRTASGENKIINAVEIYDIPSGATHFTASSNDCVVRVFDMEKYHLTKQFQFLGQLITHPRALMASNLQSSGTTQMQCWWTLEMGRQLHHSGHLDYSFASAWHPNGNTIATGNQDKTCRIWDIRNPSKSLAVLKGNLGAIRSIRYSSDGCYMAMAEPADFVHLYDVTNGYEEEQEIDFFGEISGISFSPDTESLFIGVWDRVYGSLMEYGRRRN